MSGATASVKTENASRYLQTLCKHWSHKGETDFSPETGWVAFASGNRVDMQAAPAALEVKVTSGAGEDLDAFLGVVEEHLKRFGFREELVFDWAKEGT